MNQRILLADNSYTIRRIVELSFQDIENVELFSFESGANLKEKLLKIIPQIVLIDIRLPEFNGYEACRFINDEPSLKDTKVLLMKGGFEPIDEFLLKDLNYEDIITKPFDSKLLESQVIKLLKEIETIAPSPPLSIPEELDVPSFSDNLEGEDISIETTDGPESFPDNLPDFNDNKDSKIEKEGDGISFSDINDDMGKETDAPEFGETVSDTEKPLPVEEEQNEMNFKDAVAEIETPEILSDDELIESERSILDEVEPSEEITQGAYEEPNDTLLSDPEDEILNPFKDESEIKTGESSQETDEHNLKEQIKLHEDELGIDSLTIEEMRIKSEIENRNKGLDDEENDYGTDSFGGLDKKPGFENISFNDEEKDDEVESAEVEEQKVADKIEEKIDPSIFEAADGILNDDIDLLTEDDKPIDEPISDMDISVTDDRADNGGLSEIFEAEDKEPVNEVAADEIEKGVEETAVPENVIAQEPVDHEIIEPVTDSIIENEDSEESNLDMPEFGEIEEEISTYQMKEEPEIKQEIIVEEKIVETEVEQEVALEEKIEEPQIETIAMEEVPEKVIDTAIPAESIEMKKIIDRVEDKLTVSIKEILWDVIPPLAERIIKEEISALKAEIDNKDI